MTLSFSAESWIWYTFAVGIIVTRLISRTILFRSAAALQYDDWIMGLFVTSCYTVLIITSNMQARAQTNLLPPTFNINTLTAQQISDREHGSKIVVVVEQMQIAVIWSCKACLLIMYHRLTRMALNNENIAIKIVAVYVALGFVAMEVLYFGVWCRPFSSYWALPAPNSQCNAMTHHRITKAVFNISSDVVILCIALTMFIRSLLPLKKKLILCAIFSLGAFVVAASILNSYYSFRHPYRPAWVFWYTRESSTAILVANLPFTWTLLRKAFNLGVFDEEYPPLAMYHTSWTTGGKRTARMRTTNTVVGKRRPSNTTSNGSTSVTSMCTSKNTSFIPPPGPRSTRANKVLQDNAVGHTGFNLDRDLAALSYPLPSYAVVSPRGVPSDSTGGFYGNNRLLSPRSWSQLGSRPVSPMPSYMSDGTRSVSINGGGGRSARDRRARLRAMARAKLSR